MNLDSRRRVSAVLAVGALVGCMPEPSELERDDPADELATEGDSAPGELQSKTAALYGTTSNCTDDNVLRWQFTYPDQYHGNMQAFSASLPAEQRDWWDRTDCQALIVDWVRTTGPGSNSEQAFITGITEPSLINSGTNPQDCALLWVSRKILNRYVGFSSGFSVIVDNDEFMGEDCGYSFNRIPWLGTIGANQAWFSRQTHMRAVTQGFVYIFPVPVSAYMQTENDNGDTCPTECCFEGWPNLDCSE